MTYCRDIHKQVTDNYGHVASIKTEEIDIPCIELRERTRWNRPNQHTRKVRRVFYYVPVVGKYADMFSNGIICRQFRSVSKRFNVRYPTNRIPKELLQHSTKQLESLRW
jgi:hypothetical protein